jgi:hypothetical protein
MKTIFNKLGGLAAAAAVLMAAALGLASSAGAIDGDPGDPLPTKQKPNLFMAASVARYGTSQWELQYTVSNTGNAPAGAFRVAVQQNGSTQIANTSYSSLAPGASRTQVIHIPRADCYIPVRFIADVNHTVAESSEFDNDRWAVGMVSPFCPSLPKYKVKAVSFHANDETGADWLGSDEPYPVFNGVGEPGTEHLVGTQTWTYSPVYLASRLPAAGQSFTDTRTYTGGGGEYTMTVQVTRTA